MVSMVFKSRGFKFTWIHHFGLFADVTGKSNVPKIICVVLFIAIGNSPGFNDFKYVVSKFTWFQSVYLIC